MNKNLPIKLATIIGVLLVFLYGIFGIPKSLSGEGLKQAIQQRINLGLDLRGGTHLILQVQVQEAVNANTDSALEHLKDQLKQKAVSYGEITKPADRVDQIVVKGVPTEQGSALRDLFSEQFSNEYDLGSTADGFVFTLKPSIISQIEDRAVAQSIEVIRSRVDQLGVSEPVIQEHGLGAHQILVQLPGVSDPERVRQVIQSTAKLEIRQEFGGPYATQAEAAAAIGANTADRIVMPGGQGVSSGFYIVGRVPVVGGTDIRDASPSEDANTGRPETSFTLTSTAGNRFAQFTGANIGNNLSVILEGKVRNIATIEAEIHDQGRITGLSKDESQNLSTLLRSGALPASIKYLEDRVVGASLGADSIRAGVKAAVYGMLAVLIFMLVYYHGAGINADLALVLNLVILLGFLGFTGATLTLPGIAGVILTIGMGVDSNVLIFERIREELRHGKMPGAAVDQGFGHAWLTIVDTHVTTIVSAIILFIFGSGPVRGFAVTLAFGLFANLFTAVFVSRVIFDWVLSRKQRGEALSI